MTSRLPWREAGELTLVALAFLLYFIVRANVINHTSQAEGNARHLVSVERSLSFNTERSVQARALESRAVVKFANFAYFWLDFPLIAALGLVMYARRRRQYTFARDAILFSGACALVAYALFPVAPPRLLPETGVMDTLQAYNNLSYQAQSTSFFVNPYAAMPSLHVGWAVLLALGVALAWPRNRLVLALCLIHPISQWSSTVITGNHYIIDGIGGLVAASLGLVFAAVMQRWGYAWLRARFGGRHEVTPGASP